MQIGNTKLFLKHPLLVEMLNLRRCGWGLNSLALYFDCDISSIRFQCDKYDIYPLDFTVTFEHLIKPITDKYDARLNDDHINRGKSYKEYLIEAGYDPYQVKHPYAHLDSQR